MAFARPSLSELIDRVEQDFISRLPLEGAVLRRALVRVLARVVAGATHMLYGAIDFVSRQIFPDRSVAEFLLRQASLYGITPTSATFATATATVTGTNGTTVSAGHVLRRSDGAEYTTDADATISGGEATLALTASKAGADGTLSAGALLTFAAPVTNVSASATVVTAEDGNDVQDVEGVRSRLIARLRNAPQGGALSDYVAWTKLVPGVTRVWVAPLGLGPGTVLVRFMRDGDVSPFPDTGEVATVQAKLNSLRPVTAVVTAAAPGSLAVNYTIHLEPDTTANRDAVTAALGDLHFREAEPNGTLKLSHIRTAIGDATGVYGSAGDYTLASPSADITATGGQLPVVGTITFT